MLDINTTLSTSGLILFLIGLFNGFIIGIGRSQRLGLSAHLTAVQSGTFLIAIGLLWPHIGVPLHSEAIVQTALWMSLYALWLALCLAGIFGAGRGLPIAGGGIEARPTQQALVSTLLLSGILGTTISTAYLAYHMLL
jgi:(hydroxyamino)benzene mutase